jgi:UDP-glucose 4-epimerase
VSEEEAHRTVERGAYYAILPMLPELRRAEIVPAGLEKEYSSADDVMTLEETTRLLTEQRLMPKDVAAELAEVLR